MTYSADRDEIYRGAASYVDRLLRGAEVADLPVQYPTKFRLTIKSQDRKVARP
jgi:putative ABC transport system substrate-binding protein